MTLCIVHASTLSTGSSIVIYAHQHFVILHTSIYSHESSCTVSSLCVLYYSPSPAPWIEYENHGAKHRADPPLILWAIPSEREIVSSGMNQFSTRFRVEKTCAFVEQCVPDNIDLLKNLISL